MTTEEFIEKVISSPEIPLYVILGVDPDNYCFIGIKTLNLSVRANNCAMRANASTIGAMLELTYAQISSWHNAGKMTITEILSSLCGWLILSRTSEASKSLKDYCLDMLSQLSLRLTKKNEGDELYIDLASDLIAYMTPDYQSKDIVNQAIRQASICNRLQSAQSNIHFVIPDFLMNKEVLPFLQAYQMATDTAYEIPSNIDKITFAQVDSIFDFIKAQDKGRISLAIEWSINDINSLINTIFEIDTSDRAYYCFEKIADERTLDEIGGELGLTRERIRQMGLRASRKIRVKLEKSKLIEWFYGFFGAPQAIYLSDLSDFLTNTQTSMLRKLLEKDGVESKKTYHYHDSTRMISFDPDIDEQTIGNLVTSLPNMLSDDSMDGYLLDLSATHKIDVRLLLTEVRRQFVHYQNLYVRDGAISTTEKCAYILRVFFSNGISITDDEEMEKFRAQLITVFGGNDAETSLEYLKRRIPQSAYMIDSGVYRHISFLSVSAEEKETIASFLDQMFIFGGRTAISFNEIFGNLEGQLSGSVITNAYILHSVIASMPLPYTLSRDYVMLDKGCMFDNDLTDYVKKNYPINISKVAQHFFAAETQVTQVVARCPSLKQRGPMILYSPSYNEK